MNTIGKHLWLLLPLRQASLVEHHKCIVYLSKRCTFYFPTMGRGKTDCQSAIGILFSKFTGMPITRNWGLMSRLQHKTCDPFVYGALASWCLRAFVSSVPLLSYHWIPVSTISNKDYYNHMKSTLWTSCVTSSGFLHSNLWKQNSIRQFNALQIDQNRL